MSLITRKIAAFAKKVADLADRPGGTIPTAELKAQFDSSPEELRVAHNGLVDDLASTIAGSSGAEQIGSAPITGVAGATPYAQIADLKTQIGTVVIGQIPDNTITPAKLSFPAINGGTSNADVAKIFSLILPKDTRSWVATAWNADNKPTTIEIRNGVAVVCTLTMTYNANGDLTQMVANDGVSTITWTVTYTADRFDGITKAVT